jgi:tetratricopeptide (TPR) repeat protein
VDLGCPIHGSPLLEGLRCGGSSDRRYPAKWAYNDYPYGNPEWASGVVARARGDQEKALPAFATARNKLQANFAGLEDAEYLAKVSELDAGLGRKEEAILEAQRAVELLPIAKDSVNGPRFVAHLALVYAWTGERDRALEQLEKSRDSPGSPRRIRTHIR